ncbi:MULTISPECIES: hypothetical protein [Halomonadaceae]|uniref:hypothetical protein n=1 Tax=Halomonadaceae TaxID=28256 RepID=UPI001599A7F0|nr:MULTISPECIES: hypothetical protein [Halomonas]QJQ96264.1 hypothetical protein HIO72_13975 [Halomonas sp. PA5]
MHVQVCLDWDDALDTCAGALQWVEATDLANAAAEPWLDVPGAILIAGAIGTVWATAWALRAVAQQLHSFMR